MVDKDKAISIVTEVFDNSPVHYLLSQLYYKNTSDNLSLIITNIVKEFDNLRSKIIAKITKYYSNSSKYKNIIKKYQYPNYFRTKENINQNRAPRLFKNYSQQNKSKKINIKKFLDSASPIQLNLSQNIIDNDNLIGIKNLSDESSSNLENVLFSKEKTNTKPIINNNSVNKKTQNKKMANIIYHTSLNKKKKSIIHHNFSNNNINNNVRSRNVNNLQKIQSTNKTKNNKSSKLFVKFHNFSIVNNTQNNFCNNKLNIFDLDNTDERETLTSDNTYQILAKEIISFIDNLKNLQDSIIAKKPHIKELKINFEKQKYNLYKKAYQITKNYKINIDNNNTYNNYNNNINTNCFTHFQTQQDDHASKLDNYISKLQKTIEDMKNSSKFLTEQLRNENNELKEKIRQKENEQENNEKKLSSNLISVIKIYQQLSTLIPQNNANKTISEIPADSSIDYKFNLYINSINDLITKISKYRKNMEDKRNQLLEESNTKEEKNNQMLTELKDLNKKYTEEINEELYNATIEILNWIKPYLKKDNDNIIISKIEKSFEQNGIKKALDYLKNVIKILANNLSNYSNELKKKEEIIKKMNKKSINNKNCDESDSERESIVKLNSSLLTIQRELLEKLENKNNEIEKMNQNMAHLLKINKIINMKDVPRNSLNENILEKYDILLKNFESEQKKVKVLQKNYITVIYDLKNYVDNGEEIVVQLEHLFDVFPVSPKFNGEIKNSNNDKIIEDLEKENEDLKKKISDLNSVIATIKNTLIQILKDMQINEKHKNLFRLLLKLLGANDETIQKIITK